MTFKPVTLYKMTIRITKTFKVKNLEKIMVINTLNVFDIISASVLEAP
jgi:hypothetical protein